MTINLITVFDCSALKRFSNCSKISVGKTLRFKAPVCFKERNSKVCGNSRVEDGEDCDPGLLHLNDDPCCSADCKFKRSAQCRYELQKTGLLLRVNTRSDCGLIDEMKVSGNICGHIHTCVYISLFSTVTGTALAVGIASLSRQEQDVRKPLVLPVKAYPSAQVSTT